MIKMVVFDMAGTTVDEDNLVYKTVTQAINEAGYPVDLNVVLDLGAGKEKHTAIKDVLKAHLGEKYRDEISDQIFQSFKSKLKNAYLSAPVKPQKGAEHVFQILHNNNCRVVLNTGYSQSTAHQLMKRLGWMNHPYIDLLVTASDVVNGRPNPDMIHLAMKNMQISDPKTVAKIGDSAIDIEEGQRAGCGLSIGITTGAQNEAQLLLAKPSAVIHELEAILPIVESFT